MVKLAHLLPPSPPPLPSPQVTDDLNAYRRFLRLCAAFDPTLVKSQTISLPLPIFGMPVLLKMCTLFTLSYLYHIPIPQYSVFVIPLSSPSSAEF
jgi:hypothetical protein